MNDKEVFESNDVIEFYSNYKGLQPPENTIFNNLKSELSKFKMLDIGIGCGRTTSFFIDIVKEYIGVDYSAPMIEICKKTYANNYKGQFLLLDVRDLSQFEDNTFDFIFFSFNGIDHLNFSERQRFLKEINRIGKKGSKFVFSTHNLQSIYSLYKLKPSLIFKRFFMRISFFLRMLLKNGFPFCLIKKKFVRINDGTHNFRLKLSYIKPKYQIENLIEENFTNICLYSLSDGSIIKNSNIDKSKDFWLTFLCQNNKGSESC